MANLQKKNTGQGARVFIERIRLDTKGAGDLINITDEIARIVRSSGANSGSMTVFVAGSTAAVTTFEYEPGLIKDMQELCERLVPSSRHYKHDETWGDANGFSHLRASLLGPSMVIPFEDGVPLLGTWQQVVLAEFDNRPRNREIIVQIIGE
jgi:secondary thiamine-phosphate synthase enzyme